MHIQRDRESKVNGLLRAASVDIQHVSQYPNSDTRSVKRTIDMNDVQQGLQDAIDTWNHRTPHSM